MRILPALLLFALPLSADEPVPEGALSRLGTTRFRADGMLRVFYTKDDRRIVGCTPTSAAIWDADSGARVKAINFDAGDPGEKAAGFQQFAYDAVRHRLAASGNFHGRFVLHVWDLAAGAKVFAEPLASYANALGWTPAGRLVLSLPGGTGGTVEVRDGAGAVVHGWPLGDSDDQGANLCIIDDTRLMVMGSNGRISVRDLATGEERAKLVDVPGQNRYPLLAATPDGKFVAVGGQQQCEVFETAGYAKVGTVAGDIHSPGRRLFLSPDGKTVYYNTHDKEGFDVASGKPAFDIRLGHASGGMVAALSHDGRRMVCHLAGRPVVYQVDTKTGLEVADQPGHETRAELFWLPGNKGALVRAPYETAWSQWSLETGRRERLFDVTDLKGSGFRGTAPLALSADGREMIDFGRGGTSDLAASAFRLADGRVGRKLFPPGHPLHAQNRTAYDPARQSVLSWQYERTAERGVRRPFTWWNLPADRLEGGFELEGYDANSDRFEMAGPSIAVTSGSGRRRDDDGGAFPYPHAVRLHSATDGKLLRVLDLPDQVPAVISCPPGRDLLLTASAGDPPLLHLWDTAAGRVIASLPKPADLPLPALAPSGRYIVQGSEAGGFAIFEPYIAKRVVAEVKVPAAIESFSFSPDGRRLATVLVDTTIVIWDTAAWDGAVADAVAERLPADLGPLFEDLAGEPGKAHAAMRFLAVAGERSIPLLKGKIAPAKAADDKRIQRAIADLDAPRYAVREKASKELAALGASAESAVRTALAARPNPEVKSRLEKLAAQFDRQTYDPATLRELRAVRVLEEVGTPSARALLGEWARGDEWAPLTRAAKKATP